jgi:hypothetical protein
MKKVFTIEYENDEQDYRYFKQRFMDAGADEKLAQRLAQKYAKYIKYECESF